MNFRLGAEKSPIVRLHNQSDGWVKTMGGCSRRVTIPLCLVGGSHRVTVPLCMAGGQGLGVFSARVRRSSS